MTAAKDQIIALIPKLKAAEIGEVRAALNFVDPAGASASRPDLQKDWLMGGIITFLTRKSLMSESEALWVLQHRTAHKVYLSKLPSVTAYLEKIEKQISTTTRHRPQLAFICASALAELLEKRQVFSVGAMLSQIDKIPEALDDAYPGYVRAGFLKFIIDKNGENNG